MPSFCDSKLNIADKRGTKHLLRKFSPKVKKNVVVIKTCGWKLLIYSIHIF